MAEDQLIQHLVFGPLYFFWYIFRIGELSGGVSMYGKVLVSGFGTVLWAAIAGVILALLGFR